MAPSAAILIGFLVVVGSVAAETIWPDGQELVYDYFADVRAGDVKPAHFASKYSFQGKLHLQATPDEATVKLQDLRYQMYNGEFPEIHQTSSLPIPEDASALTTPFRIQYKDGKVKKVFTEHSDPLWVLNMKKGLASLLQLDLTQRMRMDQPSSFWGVEDTIFGTCDVAYAFQHEEDTNILTKTVNPTSCSNYPRQLFTSHENYGCGHEDQESPLSSLYKRTYRIKLGDVPLTTDISSEFVTGYIPLKGHSDLDYVKIEQKLHLIKNEPIQEKFTLTQEQEVQDLRYGFAEPDAVQGTAYDMSHGRIRGDTDSYITKAVSMLDEILEYQDESHVDAKAPEHQRQSLVQTYTKLVLARLGIDALSTVYTQLSQGTSEWEVAKRDLFVKLLPQVGTHAAAISVRNLIRKHKVKTWTAQGLLQSLPFNVRYPSEKLLHEMEELIHLDEEYPEELRHAAILSFATLVFKAAKHNTAEFRTRTVDKYADLYMKRISESKDDFKTQFVYLQGLDNMRVGKAAQYIEALALEPEGFSRHVEHMAMWYNLRNVIHNYDKAYRIFWPVLINTKKHLQLRAAALTALMESSSRMEHLMTINAYMLKHKDNIHLYKLYYKLLKSKTTTTMPCFNRAAEFATKMLNFVPAPTNDPWGTGMESYDFTDNFYGFGKGLRLQAVADHATGYPSVLYSSFHDHSHGYMKNPFSVYVKLEGLEQVLWGVTDRENDEEPNKAPAKVDMMGLLRRNQGLSTDDLIKKVSQGQGKLDKPVHIELVVYKHDQAVYTLYFNNSELDRVMDKEIPLRIKELKNLFQNLNLNQVDFPYSAEYHTPTDLGIPLIFSKDSSNIMSVQGATKAENGVELEATIKRSSVDSMRSFLFNPLAGSWHGVLRKNVQDCQLPLRFGVKRDDKGFKVVFGTPQGVEGLNATIGSRWYSHDRTFIYEEESNKNLLGASCAACKRQVEVSKPNSHPSEMVLVHSAVPGTGLVADVRVFDCERDVSITSLKKLVGRFFDRSHMNSHDCPYMRTILAINHLQEYAKLSPPAGRCGFLVRFVPDPDVGQGSQVEFTMKMTGGEIPGGNIVLQGDKLRVVGEWILKGTNGNIARKTDIRLDILTTSGNEQSSVALQLSSYENNKATSKWCTKLSKNYPARKADALAFGWGNEEVISKVVFTVGSFEEDTDGDCPSNSVSVVINMKGEITDEQKQRAQGNDWPYGQCNEDKRKAEWQNPNFVPTTQACYQGAILLTAANKVTYSLSHSQLPPYVEDIVSFVEEYYRSLLAPHFQLLSRQELTEPGQAEIVTQYSSYKPTMDISVKTPTRHYSYLEVPTGASDADDYNPNIDNTHFSRLHLFIEKFGISKPCFVSTENVYTPDNATVPHKQSSEYVLVAGIAGDSNRFSAYTKSLGGSKPMALKLVNDGVVTEISRDGVTLNGKAISLDQGVQYPADDPDYAIRIWKMGDLVMTYSRRTAVYTYFTGQAADVEQPVTNRGRATGLCGNLNGDPADDYEVERIYL